MSPLYPRKVSSSHPDEPGAIEPGIQSASVPSCPCQGGSASTSQSSSTSQSGSKAGALQQCCRAPDCLHKPVRASGGSHGHWTGTATRRTVAFGNTWCHLSIVMGCSLCAVASGEGPVHHDHNNCPVPSPMVQQSSPSPHFPPPPFSSSLLPNHDHFLVLTAIMVCSAHITPLCHRP